ncbi:MAG: choline-sulfatase [Verrucomicrobiota bacterium]
MSEPPNILFIICDQLAPHWLDLAHTPNIDALRKCGSSFQHAYCNSPICAPSRASFVTGQLPSAIGAYDNGSDFARHTPTFMHVLASVGYDVRLSGKAHFIGPDQHHGFEKRLTPDIYPASHVWTPDWNESPVHNPGTAVDQLQTAGLCKWSMQMDYDEETQFRALEALRDLARMPTRPWFLNVSYTHPHDPFITTQKWWDLYDHDQVPMPSRTGTTHHPYDDWLQTHHMIDVYPPKPAHIRSARRAYLANISYLDHKIGELIEELKRLQHDKNTLIILTSDHGEMLGEHDMWFKRTWREPSVRVPLIFAGPKIAPNQTIESEASLLDLFPTFLASAGLAPQPDLPGESLLPALQDNTTKASNGVFIEYLSEGVCQPMRGIVHNRLKYIHVHDTPPDLLFDLTTDPHETKNLANNPAYAERLKKLRSALHENWHPTALRESILSSQQKRRNQHSANPPSWDVFPDIDPTNQYVRKKNAQATNESRRID